MKQKRIPGVAVLMLLQLCFLISTTAFGQGTTSRVTGTVTDQSSAGVPEATVTLTNVATSVVFTTKTSSGGVYVFESVQVGDYTITVEKDGFKKFVSTSNPVSLGQPTTVDVKLEVGAVTDVVQVSGGAELVQISSSGNFGNTVEQRALETLPIVGVRGRNPLSFINFQPGVVSGANTGPFQSNDRLRYALGGQNLAARGKQ